MTRAMKWLTVAAVSLLAAAGCGDDDDEPETTASSPAQTCLDSWNAEANEGHQTSLAGIVSAVGLPPDEWRVGTWPEAEQTVPVWTPENAFADTTDENTVPADSCLIVAPESHQGDISFFEAEGGEWQLVKSNSTPRSKFPAQARQKIADPEQATADALGKLTLSGDGSEGTGTTQEQSDASANAEAARRLENYLKKHTGNIKGAQTERGKVISYVEAAEGELRIWTLLNAGSVVDEKPARQICRVAMESGIPEAQGAHLLDAGAEESMRCGRKS